MSEKERPLQGRRTEKKEYYALSDIAADYMEVVDLVKWLIHEGPSADLEERSKNRYRLNSLLMKHEISPEDLEEGVKVLKNKVKRNI